MVETTSQSKEDKKYTLADKIQCMVAKEDVAISSEIGFLDLCLDGVTDPKPQEKIILTSYPRCGNTLMRSYLEQLSRVFTGSDCDLRRPMNQQLKDMGLCGEGNCSDEVWIVKTHFPERIGRRKFKANKCIVIVRNPLDAFYSLFNMIQTSSHNQSIDKDLLDRALKSKIWDDFVT
jgi:hypothetical protein